MSDPSPTLPVAQPYTPPDPPAPLKPGWKTTEFAGFAATTLIGLFMASGVVADGSPWMRAAGAALALLSQLGYGTMRTVVKSGAAALVLVFVVAATPACTSTTRVETLQATQLSISAARDSLNTYDQIMQDQIVAQATSAEDGKAKLTAWRAKRDHLVVLIAAAYRAVAIAGELNDKPSLDTAKLAVAQVIDAIQALTSGGTP